MVRTLLINMLRSDGHITKFHSTIYYQNISTEGYCFADDYTFVCTANDAQTPESNMMSMPQYQLYAVAIVYTTTRGTMNPTKTI